MFFFSLTNLPSAGLAARSLLGNVCAMRRLPLLFSLLLLAPVAQAQSTPSPKIIERYKQMLAANPVEGTALDRLWKIYADQGQTGQLLDEFKSADSFAARMIFGHLLRRAGKPDEAIAAYQRAAKLDSGSALPPLALAHLENERSHPRDAAHWLEQAVALLPKDDPRLPDALLQLGSAWVDAGETASAAEAWEKAVALNPADLALRRKLASAYEHNELPDRALEHWSYIEAHSTPTDRPLVLQQVARIQQSAGHQDAAIAALEKALALVGPGNWLRQELESQLIRLHQRYHRTAELEERWKKYAAENPRDLGAYLQLIELYERLGDLDQQRTWLEKLTQLVPKNLEYRAKSARLLVQMDRSDDAVAAYDQLLKEQPANIDFVLERARLDVQRDATPAAKQRLDALLAARPNDESVRARVLEFFQQNHLTDFIEERLIADATTNEEEALAALANFYFTEHRDDDARTALQRLVRPSASPAKQAAAHARIAQILRAQNDIEHAEIELQAALKLQPGNREFHFALGDLYVTRGDYDHAQTEFQNAVLHSNNDTERDEADQKLFESLRASAPGAAPKNGRISLDFSSPTAEAAATESNPALNQFVLSLADAAQSQNTEAAWLRLARWQMWSRDTRAATASIQKALSVNTHSIAAYELLVKLQTTSGPSPGAVESLDQLARIDPANRASYDRRAGQLELQAGHIPEALAIFERLAAENPGNADALTDLALTQQRAEHWAEAVATWNQVYALSPVSRRRETLAPLLHALEKLNHPQASAEFQLKAIEAETDDRERFTLFNDLLAHCSKNGLLDWLRTQFEKRRRQHADDYFTEVALGRILKASGQPKAAFDILADASYAAPNQADALPDLIREAEDLHKLDAAVKLQEQLLRISPQESSESWQKLAQLQERAFAIDAAQQTWDRIVTKFPRDAVALGHAVDFQMAWGTPTRAVALLRKLRAVDQSDTHALSTLASLDLEAGNTREARSCLEQILRQTTPEKPGDPIRFPAMKPTEAGRLQTAYLATVGERHGRPTPDAMGALRSFWVDEADKSGSDSHNDRDLRLNAIRQLAQIFATSGDTAAHTAWLDRWRKDTKSPGEALWALFYAGDGAATLDRLEAMMKQRPRDSRVAQAFIWLALQSRQYARLAAWLKDPHRTLSERDYVFVALGQALDGADGKSYDSLVETLFAEGTHLRPWQGAMLFAGHNRYREAIVLGRRVFDNASSQRAAFGQELAHWHLLLGEAREAREVLKAAISLNPESLDGPICAALREYYLLLPENERAEFVKSYLAALEGQNQPLYTALAGALLHGLSGDEPAARADLKRLIAMRALTATDFEDATSGTRQLRFVLETGAQLESLKLEDLAAYFWEEALGDNALVQLQGEHAANLAHDIRLLLCALRAATAPPDELPKWLDLFTHLSPSEGLTPLANALAAKGAHARAIEIYRGIWERDPADTEALRTLLTACHNAGDDDTAGAVLHTLLSDGGSRLPDGAHREFLLQYADVLERQSDLDGARAALASAVEGAPGDTRLLLRLGQLHEHAGHPDQAIAAYQRLLAMEPGNLAARLALSAIYENQNRLSEALALFQAGEGPDFDARLAVLQARNNQPEAALSTLDRILPPQHITPALGLAAAFAARNDLPHARAAVQSALARTADARLSFALQCKLIELLTPADGPAIALRELRRLRRFGSLGDNPGLLGSYLDFAAAQSVRLNVRKQFQDEVQTLWAAGAGPIPAGVTLLAVQLDCGDKNAAHATLGQLLSRDDASDSWLGNAAEALDKAGDREALARVQERITKVNPLDEQNFVKLAHTLKVLGRLDEARAQLELLALRAQTDEDSLGRVAAGFADLGDIERARHLYTQAARTDRYARNWATLLDYARLQSSLHDFAGARRTLESAFNVPANRGWSAIIDWLVAASRLDHVDEELPAFALTPPREEDFRRALFDYFEKAGRPANALALAESHSSIIQPSYAVRLRKLAATTREFARSAKLLERLAAQASSPQEYSLELARLQGDWAQSDLAASQPEAALTHLHQAHEQHPELFDIAFRLSALQQQRGDRQGAIETLESYLAVGKVPTELDQARAQLAKLRSGG
jgi:tetratricopeptide (TPR) repeat protein